MRAGSLDKWVTLSRSPQTTDDSDGYFEDLSPNGAWAGIQPLTASDNGRTLTHLVRMRFHPQVTMDTRIVYSDATLGRDRELFVKGFQNLNERNAEMQLICEEVVP